MFLTRRPASAPERCRQASWLSPATYLLRSVRGAFIDGRGIVESGGDIVALVVFAAVLVPVSIAVFPAGERWAAVPVTAVAAT